MIALDTNVLVRFLVEDDEAQARQARSLIERVKDSDTYCFISDVVLCELVWVLQSSYRLPRAEIAEILRKILRTRHLGVTSPERALRALDAFDSGRGDFADYMIREHGREAGCRSVATFDRDLLKDTGFIAP